MSINTFWNDIAAWETMEVKNESRNVILASARAAERMKAYVRLFYILVGIQ